MKEQILKAIEEYKKRETEPMKTRHLNIPLPVYIYNSFTAFCKKHGIAKGRLIKLILEEVLDTRIPKHYHGEEGENK